MFVMGVLFLENTESTESPENPGAIVPDATNAMSVDALPVCLSQGLLLKRGPVVPT